MFLTQAIKKAIHHFASRPLILFFPFLVLYGSIVIIFSNNELTADEPSYLAFASNLLHGFYSPPPPAIDLWHAPGYPMLLSPFVAADAPLLLLRLLNACLLYFSVVLFYKLLLNLISEKKALLFSVYSHAIG